MLKYLETFYKFNKLLIRTNVVLLLKPRLTSAKKLIPRVS